MNGFTSADSWWLMADSQKHEAGSKKQEADHLILAPRFLLRSTVSSHQSAVKWALALLLALFLVMAALYAWVTPPLEGFDALAHYRAVVHLRANPRPPLLDKATLDASYELITQPPLYHALAALAATPWPVAPTQALVAASANPYFEKGLSERQTLTLPDASWTALAPLWAARMVSLLGALLLVTATWLLARTLIPARWTFALATASVVAFNPVLLFLAVTVTNDAWAAGTVALTVALAARAALEGRPPHAWFWAGAAGGLALLAKYSGFLVALPALVMLAFYARRQGRKPALQAAGYALLGGALVAGYWLGRNWLLYGELVPLNRMAVLITTLNRAEPWPWPLVVEYMPWLVWSYWGIFVATVASPALLETVRWFMLIGLAGLPVALLRGDGDGYAAQGWTFVLAGVWAVVAAAAVIHWTRTVSYGEQGRLAHIAAPALALLWVLGWQAWLPVRWRPAFHLLLAVGMVGLALWGAQTLHAAYRLPPGLPTPPQPDRPIGVRFAGGPELLGVDFPEGAALMPGRPMPLTLYWTTSQVIPANYTLFLHLADGENRLLYQFDGVPAQGRHPTRQWQPGQIFADSYTISVGEITAPGLATFSLGLYPYNDPTQRLAVSDATGAPVGDRVVLGQVRLHPEPETTPEVAEAAPLATWEQGITLQSVEVLPDTQGRPAGLRLRWRSNETLYQDYTLFAQVLDRQNRVLAQIDQQPQAGAWPTSTWRAGDVIDDQLEFMAAPDANLDDWQQVIVGWYDGSGRRLSLVSPDAGQDFFMVIEQDD
jgi:hypothetical protein